MSTLKVNALNNDGSAIDLPNSFKLGGNPIEQGYTSSASEPTSPSTGDLWWDSANEKLYQYLNGEFKEISLVPANNWYGDRGLIAGGLTSSSVKLNTIDYFDHSTTGNTTDFGDLTTGRFAAGTASDGRYGVFIGGSTGSNTNVIDYVTVATTGNATDFGDMRVAARNSTQGIGDGTYGVYSNNANSTNNIDYITIATPSNSTLFGTLTQSRDYSGGHSDGTTGFICGGSQSTNKLNIIDYVTIATTGNATDFGDLTEGRSTQGGGDESRCVMGGGESTSGNSNVIDYFATATAGNATDFGDMFSARRYMAATTNFTRVVWAGGFSHTNIIQYVTIQTTGNGTDFGDLSSSVNSPFGTSGAAA